MDTNWKRKFFTIYAGQAFSLLGSAAVQFAVIWQLTVQSESAVTLTSAMIVLFLPNLLFGPFAGVWIDRYNRRTVMIAADSLVAVSSAVLGITFLITPVPPVSFIFLILFVRGLGNTFHSPAMQAAIPLFVPVEMLTKAGGWGSFIVSVSTMLGPALGAILMAAFPVASIMLVDIAGALIAVSCLLAVRIPDIPGKGMGIERGGGGGKNLASSFAGARHGFLSDMKQGVLAIRQNRPLAVVLVPIILSTFLYMPMSALFPLLVRTHYMGEAWNNAVVEFVFSGGLLISSLVMGIWGSSRRRFLMISGALFVLGAASAVGGALPRNMFWGFAAASFFMGASGTFFNVPLMAYIQETSAPEVMGKVFSMMTTAMTLASPVGLAIAGPVSEAVGVDVWFLVSGGLIAGIGVVCYFMTRGYDAGKM